MWIEFELLAVFMIGLGFGLLIGLTAGMAVGKLQEKETAALQRIEH